MTTYGKSHGPEIGVKIDGCPEGLEISLGEIQREVDRRKPGQNIVSTSRREEDNVEIISGIINNKTTGKTIELKILNKDVDLSGYKELEGKPRPGHADFTGYKKYNDWYAFDRTGGRETACRVMAGAIAKKLLGKYNINIFAHSLEISGIKTSKSYYKDFDLAKIKEYKKDIESNSVRCIDAEKAKEMEQAIIKAKEEGNSVGGIVEVIVLGVPVGLGEPNYNKLSSALYFSFGSIPAVVGIQIGLYDRIRMRGSESNDEFFIEEGKVKTKTNYCGGILGGISNGMPIVASIGFKPTPSIAKEQQTVDLEKMENTIIKIKGRHDPCIVPRAVPVVEAMMSLALVDQMLLNGYIAC
ncbi:MAG: chorismate synthase [Patescibacteria group bacterium]|nr:chorismate synthase [Patescibacteria group bacterium]